MVQSRGKKLLLQLFQRYGVNKQTAKSYGSQGCHILEKSWKVLDFFCCPGKSLKVPGSFTRASLGQNS